MGEGEWDPSALTLNHCIFSGLGFWMDKSKPSWDRGCASHGISSSASSMGIRDSPAPGVPKGQAGTGAAGPEMMPQVRDGAVPVTALPAQPALTQGIGGSHQSLCCRAPGQCQGLTLTVQLRNIRRVADPASERPGSDPGCRHRCRNTLGSPCGARFIHLPLPGRSTPPPLGAICLVKLKSNPFDVPLPTPSQLPAKNAGDFSLSLSLPRQTSRKLFLSLCLKLQTPAGLAVSPVPAWGVRGTDRPRGAWGWAGSPGVPRQPHPGLSHPGTPARRGPAGPTSAVRESVEGVALVAEALEAAGGVDAEVVAGAVKGALVDVWRKGKGRK